MWGQMRPRPGLPRDVDRRSLIIMPTSAGIGRHACCASLKAVASARECLTRQCTAPAVAAPGRCRRVQPSGVAHQAPH